MLSFLLSYHRANLYYQVMIDVLSHKLFGCLIFAALGRITPCRVILR